MVLAKEPLELTQICMQGPFKLTDQMRLPRCSLDAVCYSENSAERVGQSLVGTRGSSQKAGLIWEAGGER